MDFNEKVPFISLEKEEKGKKKEKEHFISLGKGEKGFKGQDGYLVIIYNI